MCLFPNNVMVSIIFAHPGMLARGVAYAHNDHVRRGYGAIGFCRSASYRNPQGTLESLVSSGVGKTHKLASTVVVQAYKLSVERCRNRPATRQFQAPPSQPGPKVIYSAGLPDVVPDNSGGNSCEQRVALMNSSAIGLKRKFRAETVSDFLLEKRSANTATLMFGPSALKRGLGPNLANRSERNSTSGEYKHA
jgi:hypothetical protein